MTTISNPGIYPDVQGQSVPNTNTNVANFRTFPSQAPVTLNQRQYPVKTLRIFGGTQIGLGAACAVTSFIGVIIDVIDLKKSCNHINHNSYTHINHNRYTHINHNSYSSSVGNNCGGWRSYTQALFGFDITCIICSGWFLLTGLFTICMSQKRINNWRCLKITFMVCSIIGAAVFVPIVFGLAVTGAFLRRRYKEKVVVLSAFLAVLSFTQFVVAIVSASYCCCCSPWDVTDRTVNVVYINDTQPTMIFQTSTQMTAPSQPFDLSQNQRAQEYRVMNNHDNVGNNTEQPQVLFSDPPAYTYKES